MSILIMCFVSGVLRRASDIVGGNEIMTMQGKYNYFVEPGVPTVALKTLMRAKHPYSKPTGYATNNRWCDICKTATKIPEAAYVHQSIDSVDRTYPTMPLYCAINIIIRARGKI